nr:hypothetical protein [Tanacetum cinerariifolium]
MKVSDVYKTYYAFASGKEIPKPKYVRPSTKEKTVQPSKASPGQKLKTTAKVAKSGKKKLPTTIPKAKGLETLSEVALSEAGQIKLATKRSMKDFHISYTFSPDEDDADEETYINDDTESDNNRDDLTHAKLSTYKAHDEEEEEQKGNDDDVSSDHRVYTPPDHQLTEEYENQDGDDEVKKGEDEQEEEDELYGDLNINLQRSDTNMTNAQHENVQANKVKKDTHVTLSDMPPVVQQQSSSISSDLVSKFINPSLDIGIDSILSPNIQSKTLVNIPVFVTAETPSFDTTIPQPPIPNIQPLQQTQVSIPTTTILATTLPDMPRIIDNYLASKMKEAVDVAPYVVKSQWNPSSSPTPDRAWHKTKTVEKRPPQPWITQMAQAAVTQYSFNKFLATPIDFSEKGVSLSWGKMGVVIGSRVLMEMGEKMAKKDTYQRSSCILWDYFINNDLEYLENESSSRKYTTSITKTKTVDYGQVKKRELSRKYTTSITKTKTVDYGQVKWIEDKRFYGYASNMESSYDVYSRHKVIAVTRLKIMEWFGYNHLEEIIVRRQDDKLYKFREGASNDFEYKTLKICIIYEDKMNRNRLMRTNEFHKFSDCTLNLIRTALNDIAIGIEMDYLPKRKWSKQDKQRARVMINAIDRKLRDRRLMRNLEKFLVEDLTRETYGF